MRWSCPTHECAICMGRVPALHLHRGCTRGHHVCRTCHTQWRPRHEACLICTPHMEGDGASEDEDEGEDVDPLPGCVRRILLPDMCPCNLLLVMMCAIVFKGVACGVLAARQVPAPTWARLDDPRIALWLAEGICTAFFLGCVEYAWYGS